MNLFTKHAYEDKHGNLHYVNDRTKLEYLIPKEKRGIFKVLNERYFLALAISLVLAGFKISIYVCIAAGIMAILLLSLFRSQKFLPSMQCKKIDANKMKHDNQNQEHTKDKRLTIMLISFIIICFALLNNYYQNYQETNLQAFVLSWVVTTISCINIIKQFAILKKQKGGKQ